MDKSTRNDIQRATQRARSLLEEEYREQLEGTFDILLDGTVAAAPGAHLSEAEGVVREKLVAVIAHKQANGLLPADAVDAYLREAAFTTLNRFVALKMLEARGLVQECISRGDESSGFKEFTALAPGLIALPDKGYRLYIETLFDEIGREVRVLFDRRDVASLLWPRRQALGNLLGLLNDASLTSVWGEDETIGWVYQYFNGDDERRKMREESQAPRNSRELAVRNQFFTPRYVVQFLTDNTLGRTWYEMMRGETRLRDLDYLVRRPNEVFIAEGEKAPEQDGNANLSQEELLKQPVHIPFRTKKDPRDLRILDPACGSGHFLLYAFDLLLTIYEEAWADSDAAGQTESGHTLREDYPDLTALRREIPGLILRHNLHGIDIDPRAAQIAALALWMRAQRAQNDYGLPRADRPNITKTNIVVAESMPGDAALVEEFAATLEPPLLGALFKKMVEEMKLAGELGSLLKIEEAIADAVRRARHEYVAFRRSQRQNYLPGFDPTQSQGELDFSGIDDEQFFEEAEERIVEALGGFAESAAGGTGVRRRLFAGDAAQGIAFIDLAHHKFDVALMNPPFGESSRAIATVCASMRGSTREIASLFVEWAASRLSECGRLGCLATRLVFFLDTLEAWRESLASQCPLECVADLGHGVLDDALVEAAAFILSPIRSARLSVYRTLEEPPDTRPSFLRSEIHETHKRGTATFEPPLRLIARVPGARLAYWAPVNLLNAFALEKLGDHVLVSKGLETGEDERFLRLWWEVDNCQIENRWKRYAKGGDYSPFVGNLDLVFDWRLLECARRTTDRGSYGGAGITYTQRTTSFLSFRTLPAGVIFSPGGPGLLARDKPLLPLLSFLNSSICAELVECCIGSGDATAAGTAARNYTTGVIKALPYVVDLLDEDSLQRVKDIAAKRFEASLRVHELNSETSPYYCPPAIVPSIPLCKTLVTRRREEAELTIAVVDADLVAERIWQAVLGADRSFSHIADYPSATSDSDALSQLLAAPDEECVSIAIARGDISRRTSKLSHILHRSIELRAQVAKVHPRSVAIAWAEAPLVGEKTQYAEHLLSAVIGIAVGRFDARLLARPRSNPHLPAPFAPLPVCSPGMLTGDDGLPLREPPAAYPVVFPVDGVLVDDPGHRSDVVERAREVFRTVFSESVDARWREVEEILAPRDRNLRAWFARGFFERHIKLYSKSRRKAPIYWQLAPPSAAYSVWLYYHRFTRDTFYKVLNDYATPKLQHEERKLAQLQQEAGPNPSRSQRKGIDEQESFVGDLRAFKTEIGRIAPLWNPNLNDGVIINFAPLWRLVPHHRSWQKECKKVWDKLVNGDYDWAHLAMHLWPERVVPKCAEDRSLAIAHDLEEVFWAEDNDGKWHRREVDPDEIEQLIEERTSSAVKAALNDLLSAPTPQGGSRRKRSPQRQVRTRPAIPTERAHRARGRGANNGVDEQTLAAVKQAIASIAGGASKTDVLAATGLSAGDWSKAIAVLLERGDVNRTGERRGTRYHAGDAQGDAG